MEVRIGVQHAAREVVVNSETTPDKVIAAVTKAFSAGELLTLKDARGRTVIIPTDRLAYVEVGPAEERRVGFATDD